MRSLAKARADARTARKALGPASDLLACLRTRLFDEHQIELLPVANSFLKGSLGELVLEEGSLYYDENLAPAERLQVIAHEYGHLVLHHEYFGSSEEDLITGSAFLSGDASAVSRYSPRSRHEAEASAFAAEFLCPAGEVFARWCTDTSIAYESLAADYGVTTSLLRQQLAEGLYERVAGTGEVKPGEERTPTPQQRLAATRLGVPVLVDAGPGTGKTATLVHRVGFLVREKKEDPKKILILTFSNEAARELLERLDAYLGEAVASQITVSTFHGFGVYLLHALGHHLSIDITFKILDDVAQRELVSDLLGSVDCEAIVDLKDPEATASRCVSEINFLKDRLVGPDDLEQVIATWKPTALEAEDLDRSEALLRVYREYERAKRDAGAVDLADLILLPHALLEENADARAAVREAFRWVLVDEYQDVSRGTALFLQQICEPEHPPWVVGDARQAIYRFRGAEPENVTRFTSDFPGAERHALSENFRSCPEVIDLANRMAAVLDGHSSPERQPWIPGRVVTRLGDTPVRLAIAKSDAAEQTGIVETVHGWVAGGTGKGDVAVLARRNIDVRNVAIALKRRSIRAVTSGLLTAEGAAGDLAAAVAAVDGNAGVPRLVYALWRGQATLQTRDEAVRQLLQVGESEVPTAWTGPRDVQEVAASSWNAVTKLRSWLHSGDAWAVLVQFLFFGSTYLRWYLERAGDAESDVQLEEVLSTLSMAAAYRYSHRRTKPMYSRRGFCVHLREALAHPAPGLVAARRVDAVTVMTCHASKGLEFPCVVVAGQSLAQIPAQEPWLPAALRPPADMDSEQADSLLFVGITRAQRAVMISYAESASGTARSRSRKRPALLAALHEWGDIPVTRWEDEPGKRAVASVGRLWGGGPLAQIPPYALGSSSCRVRTYLEEVLGLRLPSRRRPLYPEFHKRVMRILQRVLALSMERSGGSLDAAAVDAVFEDEWPEEAVAGHPHLPLYRPRARQWAHALATAIRALPRGDLGPDSLGLQDSSAGDWVLKLQLVGHVIRATGGRTAIGLHVGALDSSGGRLNWSSLKNDYQKIAFVMLERAYGGVTPVVVVGGSSTLFELKWHRQGATALAEEAARVRRAAAALQRGEFAPESSDWACERCRLRTICPAFMVDPVADSLN